MNYIGGTPMFNPFSYNSKLEFDTIIPTNKFDVEYKDVYRNKNLIGTSNNKYLISQNKTICGDTKY